jgi:hypothetical protein
MNTSHRHSTREPRGSQALRRAGLLAAMLGIALAGAAGAAPQLKTIEECLESATRAVRLPGTAIGTLSASPCADCPALRLSFDARTVYQVGTEQVTYAAFREIAAKDDLRLDIFYQPQTRVLTRLRVPATGNGK